MWHLNHSSCRLILGDLPLLESISLFKKEHTQDASKQMEEVEMWLWLWPWEVDKMQQQLSTMRGCELVAGCWSEVTVLVEPLTNTSCEQSKSTKQSHSLLFMAPVWKSNKQNGVQLWRQTAPSNQTILLKTTVHHKSRVLGSDWNHMGLKWMSSNSKGAAEPL